jgi:hypothetical protein
MKRNQEAAQAHNIRDFIKDENEKENLKLQLKHDEI